MQWDVLYNLKANAYTRFLKAVDILLSNVEQNEEVTSFENVI